LETPKVLDRAEGDVHAEGNPHIQLDPRRILEVAKAMSARLQQIDNANHDDYAKRLRDFTERWQTAMSRWQEAAAPLEGQSVIVHHREWMYLLDWLGIERAGSLEPKPGVPPTFAHLGELKDLTANIIIVSPLNDAKPSQWLHEQTGTRVVTLPHTVGAVPGSDDLFGFFEEIIRRLVAKGQA
jgi:zinc/manganese transport system substrate-binding protein